MSTRVMKFAPRVALYAALAAGLPGAARADAGLQPLLAALTNSTPLINLRLRSETVAEDGFAEDAEAFTLRGRLGFQTATAWNTSLLAEANLMWALNDRYNSTINHQTRYPVVPDPQDTALDRLQLVNTSLPGTVLIIGRQRVNLDDQRFIGSVGFRQNEQTFDAARLINKSVPGLTIDLTYLDRVNRIFGNRSTKGHLTGDSYLANVSYHTPLGRLSGFGYWLAFNQDPADSTRTLGVRFAGARKFGPTALHYSLSYAHQDPYGANTLHFSVDYFAAEIIAYYAHLSAGAGIEGLQGDGVKGFTTPLATLHKFNGWADEFLTTPPNGLEDRYATVGYALPGITFLKVLSAKAIYHDLRSERLGIHYGTETDVQLLGTWRRLTGIVAYADYVRDRFGASTRKLWIEVDYALNGG